MYQKFTTAKGWRIFIYIFSIAAIIGGAYLLINTSTSTDPNFMLGMGILLFLFGAYCLLLLLRYKLTLTDDGITERWVYRQWHIDFKNASGYRIVDDYLIIESAHRNIPNLRIGGYKYLSHYKNLLIFVANRLPNLDAADTENEILHVEENSALGFTSEQRVVNLKRVKWQARFVTAIGLAAGAWTLFTRQYFEYAVYAVAAQPLLLAMFYYQYRYAVTFSDTDKNEMYPSLSFGLIITPLLLALKLLMTFELVQFTDCLLLSAIVTALLMAVFLGIQKTQEESLRKRTKWYVLLMGLSVYGMTITTGVNFVADKSVPQTFTARVLEKSVSKGKTTSYNLTVTPWGPIKKNDEVSINHALYDDVQVGQTVSIKLKKGFLDIPWYYIEK